MSEDPYSNLGALTPSPCSSDESVGGLEPARMSTPKEASECDEEGGYFEPPVERRVSGGFSNSFVQLDASSDMDSPLVLGLVLNIHAVYHLPFSESIMRLLLCQGLRFTFEAMFRNGLHVAPDEAGMYAKILHSPAHERMMNGSGSSSSSSSCKRFLIGPGLGKKVSKKMDDELDYAMKPMRTANIKPLKQEIFACIGPIDDEVHHFDLRVEVCFKFTQLQTLRLLWYIAVFGTSREAWLEVRRMAFPHQASDITEAMIEFEWKRLLCVASDQAIEALEEDDGNSD